LNLSRCYPGGMACQVLPLPPVNFLTMFGHQRHKILRFLTILSAVGLAAENHVAIARDVDFGRDIRPILADTCFKCHGPDGAQREAELRLDTERGIFSVRDGKAPIVPGQLDSSQLWRRITSDDPEKRMPPPESGRVLTKQQIATFRTWIEQGATWQQHWSFVAPQRPSLPRVSNPTWLRNGIDSFVMARLDQAGLTPASEADRAGLIRRVTLDLTGLPPTPAEVDGFNTDASPRAYENLVDRLMQTPAFGERMAVVWLDAARYADTSGYQNDGPRDMWRWRDWVIDAYNRGLAFDQFTIEQLAGDLLPVPTLDQRIATGFNRNHRGNAEGGVIPEEFQVEYVVDRVETTGTVWLGLTIGCCRCHDHKFDPISQREFYGMFAFFNTVPESGRAIKEGNSPPFIKAPTREQQRRLASLDRKLDEAEDRCKSLQDELLAAQRHWEQSPMLEPTDNGWSISKGLVAHYAFDRTAKKSETKPGKVSGVADAFQVIGGAPSLVPGRIQAGIELDGKQVVDAGDVAHFGYFDKFSGTAWIRPSENQSGTIWSRMTDAEQADGYYVQLRDGHLQVNLIKRWLDDCVRVETDATVSLDTWTHIAVTYDGSRLAAGISVYFDGKRVPLKTNYDFINQSFASTEPFRIGGGGGPAGRFVGTIDDVRIYDRCVTAEEVATISLVDSISQILKVPASQRSAAQASKLSAFYLARFAPPVIRQAHRKRAEARQRHAAFTESLPTVMIMAEMPNPRLTHVLLRGEYDKPGIQVTPGVPRVLPPLAPNVAKDRHSLARWIVDPANPLTARVAVNRYWQMYFGTGLVKTVEDFGTQGERPSHPQLLDWLATEFVRSGWDVKAMQRRIVTSATYRQSSRVTPELIVRDPHNRLLARGTRFRLPAEVLRDQALAAGGMLVETIGGPSVKPYQPSDLWKDIASDNHYEQSHGANLYRRSMYTYWKRTVAPPAMAVFDGAGREMCRVRGERTNTPLQALTMLNDVTFVEASRVLAQQVMQETELPLERLKRMYRRILVAAPSEKQLEILVRGYRHQLEDFRAHPEAVSKLLAAGEYPLTEDIDQTELAAYATMASLLLNLDATVMHQ
jgi:hypothetical protein